MMNEAVSVLMSKNLITVGPGDTLDKVKDIFVNNKIHHLPVVEGEKLVGLVTTWDLWKINKPFEQYDSIPVKKVMTTRIATLEPKSKIGTAAEVFLENLFHALPIVDEGKLVGIITSFDVLKYEFRKAYPNQAY
jgi:CBS domain-containing protein